MTVKTNKVWKLYAEYLTKGFSIMTESGRINTSLYTADNPYCLGAALHKIGGTKGVLDIKFNFPDTDTTPRRISLNLDTSAIYHRLVIYSNSKGEVVFASQDYNENGEYIHDTIYTFNPLVGGADLLITEVSTYSTKTNAIYDLYKSYNEGEYEEINDHIEEEYLFTNAANSQSSTPDDEHKLSPNLLEFTDVVKNEEFELPFYGIRRTTRSGYAYFKMSYSKSGATPTIANYSIGTTSDTYRYIKVNLKYNGSNIYVILYTYDKDQQLVGRKELSLGTGGGFDIITVQPLGFYCDVAKVHNYKKRVKELFPISHRFNTEKQVVKDVKENYNLIRNVHLLTEVKNTFNTSSKIVKDFSSKYNTTSKTSKLYKNVFNTVRDVKEIFINKFNTIADVYISSRRGFNTKSSVVIDSKQIYNTKREIIQSAKVKNSFNTASKVVKDVKTSFNTITAITAPVKNAFNTVKLVCVNSLKKYDTSRDVYMKSIVKYNTSSKVNYTSKIHYNTEKVTENVVRNAYNTVMKTEYREIFKANSIRQVEAKLSSHYNTITEIITEANSKFNTNITVENRFKIGYNTSLEIKNEYRNVFNTERKVVWKVKEKFNTDRDVKYMIKARFNTNRELDFLVIIKMLLGIQDSSKDNLLQFLVFKAIEDIHAVCNLEPNELSGGGIGYFTADSEMGQSRHLQNIVIDLAIYYYRMQGMEHIKNESIEGGSWNYIYESIPPQILQRLKPYKKMRALRVF